MLAIFYKKKIILYLKILFVFLKKKGKRKNKPSTCNLMAGFGFYLN